jgi:hypothetical protein
MMIVEESGRWSKAGLVTVLLALHQNSSISSARCNFVGQNQADENRLFISSAKTGRRN